jgi:ArsR family transcriptional regulator
MKQQTVQCCAIVDPTLGEEDAEALADRFKALADPHRVRILNLLSRNEELCVCELTPSFDLSQPTMSHHLMVLRKAGLVDCEVRGRWAYYRVLPERLEELAGVLEVEK